MENLWGRIWSFRNGTVWFTQQCIQAFFLNTMIVSINSSTSTETNV
uniref:Uncharacterized protein n=1 Tax=Anguilla anguilla TaxID=7936 RepID=A0A0E9V2L9_ANGAN